MFDPPTPKRKTCKRGVTQRSGNKYDGHLLYGSFLGEAKHTPRVHVEFPSPTVVRVAWRTALWILSYTFRSNKLPAEALQSSQGTTEMSPAKRAKQMRKRRRRRRRRRRGRRGRGGGEGGEERRSNGRCKLLDRCSIVASAYYWHRVCE